MFTHVGATVHYEDLTSSSKNGQRWYTTPEGNSYPSITTILGFEVKTEILQWRLALGTVKADKETQRCADRGTAVHLMAERYLNNEEDSTRDQSNENIKMFNQLKYQLNKINNIHAQEIALYSDALRLAGRCDCIGEYDNVLSIIDFKTSNNTKDEKMIENYFMQCTAYSLMYEELTGICIDQFVILITVEKGMMPLRFIKKRDAYIAPLMKQITKFQTTFGIAKE